MLALPQEKAVEEPPITWNEHSANFYSKYMIWSFLHKTGYVSRPTKTEPGIHKVFDSYTWSWECSLYKKPGFP